MDNPTPGRLGEPQSARLVPADVRDEISTIAEQQRETLALLRQLIEMLLPKVDPDKPKLEDLIAVLVGHPRCSPAPLPRAPRGSVGAGARARAWRRSVCMARVRSGSMMGTPAAHSTAQWSRAPSASTRGLGCR